LIGFVQRNGLILFLFALNLGLFGYHTLPAIQKSSRLQTEERAVLEEILQLRREIRTMERERNALKNDPYFILTQGERKRNIHAAEDELLVIEEVAVEGRKEHDGSSR
jgi:hypothetical protein